MQQMKQQHMGQELDKCFSQTLAFFTSYAIGKSTRVKFGVEFWSATGFLVIALSDMTELIQSEKRPLDLS